MLNLRQSLRSLIGPTLVVLLVAGQSACGTADDDSHTPGSLAGVDGNIGQDGAPSSTDGPAGSADTGGGIAAPSAALTTDQAAYTAPATVKATLQNNSAVSVFVGGCAPLVRQRQDASGWTDLGPQEVCFWEGYAQEIAPGATYEGSVIEGQAGTYRLVVEVGVGCTPQQPMSQANCASTFKVYSEPYDVAAAATVTVTSDKSSYAVNEPVKATIDNGLAESIFLGGCTEVTRELQKGGQWVDMGRDLFCFWEGYAVEVAAGASHTEQSETRFPSAGTWRLALHYGLGCSTGQPLSQAACASMDSAYSDPITVAP